MLKIFIYSLLLLVFSACAPQETMIKHKVNTECDVYSLKTALCYDNQKLVQKLENYQVVFIGDHHTQDDLHLKIANLIKAFSKNGKKVLLANEWFYPSDNKLLKKFASGTISEEEFQKEIKWKERLKRNKYDSFSPMYKAIRETKGELYGINISKADRKKLSDQNLSSMSKEELNFNDNLDLNVYPHRELILPFLSHCHAPKKGESLQACTERMYHVQVAWDSKMALESYKLSKTLKKDEILLVFAGSMHIETRLGIPLRFARLSNLASVTIIPADKETKFIDNDIGDYILFYKQKDESIKK